MSRTRTLSAASSNAGRKSTVSSTSTAEAKSQPNWTAADAKLVFIDQIFVAEDIIKNFTKSQDENFRANREKLDNCFSNFKKYILNLLELQKFQSEIGGLVDTYQDKFREAILKKIEEFTKSYKGKGLSQDDLNNNMLINLEQVAQVAKAAVDAFISKEFTENNLVSLFENHYEFEQLLRERCDQSSDLLDSLEDTLEKARHFCVRDFDFKAAIRDEVRKLTETEQAPTKEVRTPAKKVRALTASESENIIQTIDAAATITKPSVDMVLDAYHGIRRQTNNIEDQKNIPSKIEFLKYIEGIKKSGQGRACISKFFKNICQAVKNDVTTALINSDLYELKEENYFSTCLKLCKLINMIYEFSTDKESGLEVEKAVMRWVWGTLAVALDELNELKDLKSFIKDPLSLLKKITNILMAARSELEKRNAPLKMGINIIIKQFPAQQPDEDLCGKLASAMLGQGLTLADKKNRQLSMSKKKVPEIKQEVPKIKQEILEIIEPRRRPSIIDPSELCHITDIPNLPGRIGDTAASYSSAVSATSLASVASSEHGSVITPAPTVSTGNAATALGAGIFGSSRGGGVISSSRQRRGSDPFPSVQPQGRKDSVSMKKT